MEESSDPTCMTSERSLLGIRTRKGVHDDTMEDVTSKERQNETWNGWSDCHNDEDCSHNRDSCIKQDCENHGMQWENTNEWKWCFGVDLSAMGRKYTGKCVAQTNPDYFWTEQYNNTIPKCKELNKKYGFKNERDACIQDVCERRGKKWANQWICKTTSRRVNNWGTYE